MDTHLEVVAVDNHEAAEEEKDIDKENNQVLLEVLESKPLLMWRDWKVTFVSFSLTLQVVELEDRDKVACHMERAYNMDMDMDTENSHKLRMSQEAQQQLNLGPQMQMQGQVWMWVWV